VSDRPGEGTSLVDHWRGLKIWMDDRQAVYRRSWLRAPLGEPAHQPGGKELASDLNLALLRRSRGDLLWRLEHGTNLDAGLPAPLRRIGILRGIRSTQARLSKPRRRPFYF
jgi:hypothetical protein